MFLSSLCIYDSTSIYFKFILFQSGFRSQVLVATKAQLAKLKQLFS